MYTIHVYNGKKGLCMLWAFFILFGLSLDSAIAMLNKGAQLTDLSYKKTIGYALIYTLVSFLIFSLVFGIAKVVDPYAFTVKMQSFIAVAAVLCIGVFIITKAFSRESVEEKADREFCVPTLMKMTVMTNIDTFVVGACIALYGLPYLFSGANLAAASFFTVLVSLRVGYSVGAGHQRIIGMIGGIMIIIFALYLGFLALALR